MYCRRTQGKTKEENHAGAGWYAHVGMYVWMYVCMYEYMHTFTLVAQTRFRNRGRHLFGSEVHGTAANPIEGLGVRRDWWNFQR